MQMPWNRSDNKTVRQAKLVVNRILELATLIDVSPHILNRVSGSDSSSNSVSELVETSLDLLDRMIAVRRAPVPSSPITLPKQPIDHVPETAPSYAALQLIELREWMLPAQTAHVPVQVEIIDEIIRRLEQLRQDEASKELHPQLSQAIERIQKAKNGAAFVSQDVLADISAHLEEILEEEGVTAFENTGLYNIEVQEILGTRRTEDPQKKNHVCDTVSPGYQFRGRLIRAQKVRIFVLPDSNPM